MEIIKKIRKELQDNVNKLSKKPPHYFFKEPVKIRGVKNLIVRKISKKYFDEIKGLNKKEIFVLCEELIKTEYNEDQKIAFEWLYRVKKQYKKTDFSVFEKWYKKYVSNWGSCDDFCTHAFGELILQFPELLPKTKLWSKSKNRWLRRASAVILIYPIRKNKYLNEVFKIADILLLDEDDLVQKGYGWMLKETSNLYPDKVFKYVIKHRAKMPRTALRYAIEKLPEKMKKEAMKKVWK